MDGEGGKPPKKSVNTIQSEKAKATIEKREAKGGRVFFFSFLFLSVVISCDTLVLH